MKKFLTTFTLIVSGYFLISIFQACKKQHCGGTYSAGVKSIKAELKKIVGVNTGDVNAELLLETYQPDSIGIRYDSLGINVQNSKLAAFDRKNFGFASAYACDPAVSSERVRKVIITSSEDYSPEFPEGANLCGIMLIRTGYKGDGREIESSMSYRDLAYPEHNFYTFRLPPTDEKSHDITIKYDLVDGRQYSATIENVFIKK